MYCPDRITHTIRPGDNFYRIARTYDTTIHSLRELNPAADPSNLRIGQTVTVCPGARHRVHIEPAPPPAPSDLNREPAYVAAMGPHMEPTPVVEPVPLPEPRLMTPEPLPIDVNPAPVPLPEPQPMPTPDPVPLPEPQPMPTPDPLPEPAPMPTPDLLPQPQPMPTPNPPPPRPRPPIIVAPPRPTPLPQPQPMPTPDPLPQPQPMPTPDDAPGSDDHLSQEEMHLYQDMRTAWYKQVLWLHLFAISVSHGLEDVQLIAEQLAVSPDEMTAIFTHYYGEEVGQRVHTMFTEQLTIGRDYMLALESGDAFAAGNLSDQWYKHAETMAEYLSELNPHYSERYLLAMFHDLQDLVKHDISTRLGKDYRICIECLNQLVNLSRRIADYMSAGIIQQFPNAF